MPVMPVLLLTQPVVAETLAIAAMPTVGAIPSIVQDLGILAGVGASVLTFVGLTARSTLGQKVLQAIDIWFIAPVTRAAQNRRRDEFTEAVNVIISPLTEQVHQLKDDTNDRFDQLDERVEDLEVRLTALEEPETP